MTTTADRIDAITTQLATVLVQAAMHGRLLAQIVGWTTDDGLATPQTRLTAIADLLCDAGIHPGQVDEDGQPVQPPHDDDCRWCAS